MQFIISFRQDRELHTQKVDGDSWGYAYDLWLSVFEAPDRVLVAIVRVDDEVWPPDIFPA